MHDRYIVVTVLSLTSLAVGVELYRSSAMESPSEGDSVLVRMLSRMLHSSITWWSLVVLSLYLLERFDLGMHSFPWNWRKRKEYENGWLNGWIGKGSIDGPCNGHIHAHRRSGLNRSVPLIFHRYIRSQVIPTFRKQCVRRGIDKNFAMLVFTHIDSLLDIEQLVFRQITFNGKPLVDSKLTTYPERYRYDNYLVARASESDHAEALIADRVPALLAAYGQAERSHIRNPVPWFGILYSRTMPCGQCTEKIIQSLAGVCRKRTVIVYSEDDDLDGKVNAKRLTKAGFVVVRIIPR